MKILGIETSCDETAVSLIEASGTGADFRFEVLGNALASQAALHAEYGGVFPNLAKREHAKALTPLLEETLRQADMLTVAEAPQMGAALSPLKDMLAREPELFESLAAFLIEHERPPIDAIAVTVGPGLEPALWVGINFARALSTAWQLPIVAVNHMEGHIILPMMAISSPTEHSNILENTRISGTMRAFEFPALSLLISGGHTELVLSKHFGAYERIGETRDDAAGEAFDKVARLMDLPYPGGPEISRLADEARAQNIEADFTFTRPMLREDNYDFSFSGLKTAVRRVVETNQPLSDEMKRKIAREFEDTVADTLVEKTMRAIEEYGVNSVIVGGGVSANTYIRKMLGERLQSANCQLLLPSPELATDNALMIALAGYFHAAAGRFAPPESLVASGNLKLGKTA